MRALCLSLRCRRVSRVVGCGCVCCSPRRSEHSCWRRCVGREAVSVALHAVPHDQRGELPSVDIARAALQLHAPSNAQLTCVHGSMARFFALAVALTAIACVATTHARRHCRLHEKNASIVSRCRRGSMATLALTHESQCSIIGWTEQAGPEPVWHCGPPRRPGARLQLHAGQQEQWHHVGREVAL